MLPTGPIPPPSSDLEPTAHCSRDLAGRKLTTTRILQYDGRGDQWWNDSPHESVKLPSSSPQLPIELSERIIHFVALGRKIPVGEHGIDRPPLVRCALVCCAWLPRCRFHLSPWCVDLRSRRDLMSFSLFFAASPQSASKVKYILVYLR